jgi:hypothetical protein
VNPPAFIGRGADFHNANYHFQARAAVSGLSGVFVAELSFCTGSGQRTLWSSKLIFVRPPFGMRATTSLKRSGLNGAFTIRKSSRPILVKLANGIRK